jgi:hypothetical protein
MFERITVRQMAEGEGEEAEREDWSSKAVELRWSDDFDAIILYSMKYK